MTEKKSSNIASIAYSGVGAGGHEEKSEVTNVLAVTFVNGGVYHYFGVEPEVFAAFQQAESQGAFFSKTIRGKYLYAKIKDADPKPNPIVEQATAAVAQAAELVEALQPKPQPTLTLPELIDTTIQLAKTTLEGLQEIQRRLAKDNPQKTLIESIAVQMLRDPSPETVENGAQAVKFKRSRKQEVDPEVLAAERENELFEGAGQMLVDCLRLREDEIASVEELAVVADVPAQPGLTTRVGQKPVFTSQEQYFAALEKAKALYLKRNPQEEA